MSGRWFRFYADAMRNPKIARLSDKQFRLWVQLLSVASDNEGIIPNIDDLKYLLNRRLDHLLTGVKELLKAGLIDQLENGYEPHNWSKFQYKSDTSKDRVAKHRAKCNVTVTPPDTDTDTDTDIKEIIKEISKVQKSKTQSNIFPDHFEPKQFAPASRSHQIVSGWPLGKIDTELERFSAYHRSHGKKMSDWQSAWSTWVLNTEKFRMQKNGAQYSKNLQPESLNTVVQAIFANRADGVSYGARERE